MEDTQPLVGDVKSQFKYGDPESFNALLETAREEQEAMCGYPLVVKSVRQSEMRDEQNRLVIEVFATFAPAENL
jgi:hypothetical protein